MVNTANTKDFLRNMLASGKSLEDVMKEIADSANAIEQERKQNKENAQKADRQNAAARFSKSLVVENRDLVERVTHLFPTARDLAIVKLHFLEHNVPGVIAALLEVRDQTTEELIQGMTDQTTSILGMYKDLYEYMQDPSDEKAFAFLGSIMSDLVHSVPGLDMKEDVEQEKAAEDIKKPTAAKAPNIDPILKFLKDEGLLN